MRNMMPIVTPRRILRPPTLGDLDAIQATKEDAWADLQLWMTWAFNDQRTRQALEHSIRRTMDLQSQAGRSLGQLRTERHIAIPALLAVSNINQHAHAIDVCDLEMILSTRSGPLRCSNLAHLMCRVRHTQF